MRHIFVFFCIVFLSCPAWAPDPVNSDIVDGVTHLPFMQEIKSSVQRQPSPHGDIITWRVKTVDKFENVTKFYAENLPKVYQDEDLQNYMWTMTAPNVFVRKAKDGVMEMLMIKPAEEGFVELSLTPYQE